MPRISRLNLSDVPQHIIQWGNDRQANFFAEEDYRFYLDCLLDALRKYGCVAYAYVLMTNHVNLLASACQPYDSDRMRARRRRNPIKIIRAATTQCRTAFAQLCL